MAQPNHIYSEEPQSTNGLDPNSDFQPEHMDTIQEGQNQTPQHPLSNIFTNAEHGVGNVIGDIEKFVQDHPAETIAMLGIIAAFILYYHTPAKERMQSLIDNIHDLHPSNP